MRGSKKTNFKPNNFSFSTQRTQIVKIIADITRIKNLRKSVKSVLSACYLFVAFNIPFF
jgi:hypothetical protein